MFQGRTYTSDGEKGLYSLYYANCNRGNLLSFKCVVTAMAPGPRVRTPPPPLRL